MDPLGLKAELVKFANATFSQLWLSCRMKHRIQIESHRLQAEGVEDGIKALTGSTLRILSSALPVPNQTRPSYHDDCPQTRYQMRQNKTTTKPHTSTYGGHVGKRFEVLENHTNQSGVPLSNRFEVLGN